MSDAPRRMASVRIMLMSRTTGASSADSLRSKTSALVKAASPSSPPPTPASASPRARGGRAAAVRVEAREGRAEGRLGGDHRLDLQAGHESDVIEGEDVGGI